ncbi:hypothetical protein EI94DRAFT_1696186 [Lactarius quietus]|nr:hypothetical protein EI94DRAFT_1696186 [Lactarius quietus]
MSLPTIIWNGLFSAKPLKQVFAMWQIQEHYRRTSCLREWGTKIANVTPTAWHGESHPGKKGGHLTVHFLKRNGHHVTTRHSHHQTFNLSDGDTHMRRTHTRGLIVRHCDATSNMVHIGGEPQQEAPMPSPRTQHHDTTLPHHNTACYDTSRFTLVESPSVGAGLPTDLDYLVAL